MKEQLLKEVRMSKFEIVPGRGKVKVEEPFAEFTMDKSRYSHESMYERTKAQVYATGNKWAIENFHATHD